MTRADIEALVEGLETVGAQFATLAAQVNAEYRASYREHGPTSLGRHTRPSPGEFRDDVARLLVAVGLGPLSRATAAPVVDGATEAFVDRWADAEEREPRPAA